MAPTITEVLEQADWLYGHLPADLQEVFLGRLTKEVDHQKEQYGFYLPQQSVDPDEAVEKLGLTPPVEEEVSETPEEKVTGLTTSPDYSTKATAKEVPDEVVEDEPVVDPKTVSGLPPLGSH